jgi:hypothetical protein
MVTVMVMVMMMVMVTSDPGVHFCVNPWGGSASVSSCASLISYDDDVADNDDDCDDNLILKSWSVEPKRRTRVVEGV